MQTSEYQSDLKDKLGQGSYSHVYLGHSKKDTNIKVALKELRNDGENILESVKKEFIVMQQACNNINIMKLLDFSSTVRFIYIIMEFCNLGDLAHYIETKSTTLSQEEKVDIMMQCANGMCYLHNMEPPVIHRDLKPQNILMKETNSSVTVKISDFGLSKVFGDKDKQYMSTEAGTPRFRAPEMFDYKDGRLQYTSAVDVFALGLVYLVLFKYDKETHDTFEPYDNPDEPFVFYGTKLLHCRNKKETFPTLFEMTSEETMTADIKALICKMVTYEVERRPTMAVVLNELQRVDSTLDVLYHTRETEKDIMINELRNEIQSLKSENETVRRDMKSLRLECQSKVEEMKKQQDKLQYTVKVKEDEMISEREDSQRKENELKSELKDSKSREDKMKYTFTLKEGKMKSVLQASQAREENLKFELEEKETEMLFTLRESQNREDELKCELKESQNREAELTSALEAKEHLMTSKLKDSQIRKKILKSALKDKEDQWKSDLKESRSREDELKSLLNEYQNRETELISALKEKENESRSKLEESQKREDVLQSALNESQDKKDQLKFLLKESHSREDKLTLLLNEFQTREAELCSALKEREVEMTSNKEKSQRRENEMKSALMKSEGRKYDLICKLQETQDREVKLKLELLESQFMTGDLQSKLKEIEDREIELRFHLLDSKDRENKLKFKLKESKGRENKLKCKVEESEGRENKLKSKVEESDVRENKLKCKMEESEGMENKLKFQLEESERREDRLKAELNFKDNEMKSVIEVLIAEHKESVDKKETIIADIRQQLEKRVTSESQLIDEVNQLQTQLEWKDMVQKQTGQGMNNCYRRLVRKGYKVDKHVDMSESCWTMKISDNKLFCTTSKSLLVYTIGGDLLSTVKFNYGGQWARSTVAVNSHQLIVADIVEGVFLLNKDGERVKQLCEGQFSDLHQYKGKVYGLECEQGQVVVFELKRQTWSKSHTITLSYANADDYDKLCVNNNKIYTSSWDNHCLQIYDIDGILLSTNGKYGADQRGVKAGLLCGPFLCDVDNSGTALIADMLNHCLQIRTATREWQVITLPQEVSLPTSAVVNKEDQSIWMVSIWSRLFKIKAVNVNEPCVVS